MYHVFVVHRKRRQLLSTQFAACNGCGVWCHSKMLPAHTTSVIPDAAAAADDSIQEKKLFSPFQQYPKPQLPQKPVFVSSPISSYFS